MKKLKEPRVLLIVSMFIFGTIGLFVRNINLASAEIALYRAVLASILLLSYLFITKQKIEIKKIKKSLILLLVSGAAMGFNWIFLFEAYNYTTVSVATLSYYFAPVIVTVLCPILFKEKLTKKQILCFVMSSLGIILITGIGEVQSDNKNFIGILFGLCAAVLYATVILINKFIKDVEAIHRTFLQFLSAVIVLFPYVLLTCKVNLASISGKGLAFLLIVGLIHTGVNYCLYFASLKSLPGQQTAILSYIDPLVAVLVSVLILSEPMNIRQIIGGILVLGFTLLNEITIKKSK